MMTSFSSSKVNIDFETDSKDFLNKECPFCEVSLELIKVELPLFQHFGFIDLGENGVIGRCPRCQLLVNILDFSQQKKIDAIYESSDYAQGQITNQTYFVKDINKRVTRSYLQAEILKGYLSNTNTTKILDIGCFDGELLRELSDRVPEAQFHGFDVNEYLKPLFPEQKNFTFWSSGLENIKEKFDLICLSCSMMYIKDMHGLFKHIQRLIKPEGKLFIQMPDMSMNPYSLLLADQYFYFTPCILKNILSQNGFDCTFIENDCFPRDVVVISKLTDRHRASPPKEDLNIYQIIQYLREQKEKLEAISDESNIGVLGTTVTAAFVDGILGDKNLFFVDENVNRTESSFRGKKVVHPKSMDRSEKLILPYGPSNKSIKERFLSEFNLNNFEELR